MSFTITQRPNQYNSHVATGNPIVYKGIRKDYATNSITNSGGLSLVKVTGDITPNVNVGDIIYLELDNGAIKTSGAVTAKSYGAPDTSITLNIPYVAGTTGWINLLTNRAGYYLETEIWYDGGALVFSALRPSASARGDLMVDVAGIVNEYLTGDVTPYLGYGLAPFAAPLLFQNNRVNYHADMSLGFYIKYREVWIGSANSQTSDSANPFYAVKAARTPPVSPLALGSLPFYGGYMKEYSDATGRKFLTKFTQPRMYVDRPSLLSYIDSQVNANDRTHLRVNYFLANGNPYISMYHLPGNATPTLKGVYTLNGFLLKPIQYIQYDKEFGAGTSWTNLGSGTLAPTVTLAAAATSKQIGIPVIMRAGISYTVVISFSVAAGAGAETVFARAGAYSLNGVSTYATVNSANFGQNTTQEVQLVLTPSTDSYWLWIDFVHNGGVNNRAVTVNYYYIALPDFATIIPGTYREAVTIELINRNAASLTESAVISETLTCPVVNSLASPVNNPIELCWTNSTGGQSSHVFPYSQTYWYRYQDGKRKRIVLYDRGISTADWEAINELNSTGEIYKVPINEMLTTIDRTHRRKGIDVIMTDADGNRIGVIVIPAEIKTRSERIQHNIEITIELPDIFEVK